MKHILSFLVTLLLISGLAGPTQAQTPQGWPQYRKENTLAGRVEPTTVALKDPANFMNIPVGGAPATSFAADLLGSGNPDIILVRNGRVTVVRLGVTVFDTFLGITDIATITDLDGDNRLEIIAYSSYTLDLFIINADGNLRSSFRFPEVVTLLPAFIKVADINPELPGKEIICFPDHTNTEGDAKGYFFDSSLRPYATPLIKNLNGGQLNSPQLAVGDIEGKGIQQVVVVGRPWLFVFDGSGKMLSQTEFREGDPEGRHYGMLTLANMDDDPALEAVIIADEIPVLLGNGKLQALTVFDLVPTPRIISSMTFPGENPRAITHSVADLDGNGKAEIVLNVWNGKTQAVRVYGATPDVTGKPRLLISLENHYAWDVLDVSGDGKPEIYTSVSTEEFPSLPLSSTLELYGFSRVPATGADPEAAKFTLIGTSLANSQYVMQATDFSLLANSGASTTTRSQLLVPDRGNRSFLFFQGKNAKARLQVAVLAPEGVVVDQSFPRPGSIRGLFRANTLAAVRYLVAEEADGVLTGKIGIYDVQARRKLMAATTSFVNAPSGQLEPRVADLDADGVNELVLRLSSRRISVFSVDPATGTSSNRTTFEGNSVPVIADLDPPGTAPARPEIIVTRNDGGRLLVQVYDTAGSLTAGTFTVRQRWGRTFPEHPSDAAVTITVGRFFGKTLRAGVFVSFSRSEGIMLTGDGGDIVWRRPEAFSFSNQVSVRDADGDGDDELYLVSNEQFSIRKGTDGTALFGPVDIRTLEGDFYATPLLLSGNEMLLAGPARVARISSKNQWIWDFAKVVGTEIVRRTVRDPLPGVATVRANSGDVVVGANYGPEGTFSLYRMTDGILLRRTLQRPVTDIVTVLGVREAAGREGISRFVFGTTEGNMVAVRADTGEVSWQLSLGAFPTAPIVAQLGASQTMCLICSAGDGMVRIYPL
ncbi:MAG: SMP-30/gluconolactonase/LRE family protein [Blastocatellia bacterium]|nr:SMP-30/gluconolactonase/LRE family protein [Blastocatellia bacterium]